MTNQALPGDNVLESSKDTVLEYSKDKVVKKPDTLSVALIQMNSTADYDQNMTAAITFVRQAIDHGAKFIALPEVFYHRSPSLTKKSEAVDGPSVTALRQLAKAHGVAILAGSIYETILGQKKVYNTSVLIDEKGAITGVYRKIHLFNVSIEGTRIMESLAFEPGSEPVVGHAFGLNIGLSVCYDIRFPELFRYYSSQNVDILTCPASFTKPTGIAHWHVLCRARAIENQAFVLAPNQTGVGAGNVASYGHSIAVDPWGKILAEASESEPEIVYATLNLTAQIAQRKQTPFLTHRRI